MRQELRWALGGTVLLSAAAWLWPQAVPRVVSATEPGSNGGAPTDGGLMNLASPKAPLPPALEPLLLEPARRDAFSPMVPIASAAVAAPPPAPQPAPVPLTPQPAAPPLALRYLGRMMTPDGLPMVLLARGDAAVPVQTGMVLDEGYQVLRITAEAIRLVYPPTGAEVDIPIPLAPTSP